MTERICDYDGCELVLTTKGQRWCSNSTPPYHGLYGRRKAKGLHSGAAIRKQYGMKKKKWSYRRFKGAVCEWCDFVPVDAVQLDVDHIDGNHRNNARSNLQTLCANCHRLKTKQERLSTS